MSQTIQSVIECLGLPSSARVDQRVPKKLLLEKGARVAADKKLITEGVEECIWLAALQPATCGVQAYKDPVREYLEIEVLSLVLRTERSDTRLLDIVHRAIPYPLILLSEQSGNVTISLAHKRWSQGQTEEVVLDEDVLAVSLNSGHAAEQSCLAALSLAKQPRENMLALYDGWLDTLFAFRAALITDAFTLPVDAKHAARRRKALQEHAELERRIAAIRQAATKEKQMSRKVEYNLELKRLQAELATALTNL